MSETDLVANSASDDIDHSVLIHPDVDESRTETMQSQLVYGMSAPQHNAASVPPPSSHDQKSSEKTHVSTNSYQMQMKVHINAPKRRLLHKREASVGNLIPKKYVMNASSLIALLDQTRSSSSRPTTPQTLKNIPYRIMASSKSVPVKKKRDSLSLHSDDDFADNPPLTEDKEVNANAHGKKSRVSQSDLFSDDSLVYNNSEQNILDIAEDEQLTDKNREYMDLVGLSPTTHQMNNAGNNDQAIDLQALAMKAAQEFADLAHSNDKLYKEHEKLKEKYDDILDWRAKIQKEMEAIRDNSNKNNYINDELEILKSKSSQWKIEKRYMQEQIDEYRQLINVNNLDGNYEKQRKYSDSMGNRPKFTNDISQDAESLMKESLAKMQSEKNLLEQQLEEEKFSKRDYDKKIASLVKKLTQSEEQRELLSSRIDIEQQKYFELKETQTIRIKQLEQINRTTTDHQQVLNQQQKLELIEALEEKEAYIEQLELDNQRLGVLEHEKIKEDDDMFAQLQKVRTHRFIKSSQLDLDNNGLDGLLPNHARGASQSLSMSSNIFALGTNDMYSSQNGFLAPVRTKMNLFGMNLDEESEEEDEIQDIQIDINPKSESEKEPNPTPIPNDNKKGVSFDPVNKKKLDKEKKDGLKRQKMEQISKVNAEIEFFLLTCIAVKSNLCEEYPEKPEVLTEDAMELFNKAQKEQVAMAKFNLWIELGLREKYGLDKTKGFTKWVEKHKQKLARAKDKIVIKGQEVGGRLRAISKGADFQEGIGKKNASTPRTIVEENVKNHDELDKLKAANSEQKLEIDDLKKKLENKPDSKKCCLIM